MIPDTVHDHISTYGIGKASCIICYYYYLYMVYTAHFMHKDIQSALYSAKECESRNKNTNLKKKNKAKKASR